MAAKYPNLAAEVSRCGITYEDLYSTASDSCGKKPETASKWFRGKIDLPIKAAFAVRDEYFPKMTVDYLFADKPIP